MTRKIALIGYGAIARAVCAALAGDPATRVTQVILRSSRLSEISPLLPAGIEAIATPEALHADTDFVLECAGHGAVRDLVPACLARGFDTGIVSAGVLADAGVLDALRHAALRAGARITVIPGAIGGIDALAAAGTALTRVRYSSVKPPRSWAGSPAEETHDLAAIDAPTVLFSGTARAAALTFPKNANVVATVALAGIGFDDTQVTLVADPAAQGNTHRIEASGPLYDFDYRTGGAALPDNPRTSALTALSALRAIRQRGAGLQV